MNMKLPVIFVSHREWLERPDLVHSVAHELAEIKERENRLVKEGKRKFDVTIQAHAEDGYILVWGDEHESAHEIISWLEIHNKTFGYYTKKLGEPLRRHAEGGLVTTVELIQGRRLHCLLQKRSIFDSASIGLE